MSSLEVRRHVPTHNAEANTHMNAVNEAIGYRQVEWCFDVPKELML